MFDSEKFIRLIEYYPAIYDFKSPNYLDKIGKSAAWHSVAEGMTKGWNDMPHFEKAERVRNLQKKWKNIRDCFLKEYKLQQKYSFGCTQPKRKKYVFYDQLLFLLPSMLERNCMGKLPFMENESNNDGENDSEEESPQPPPNQELGESTYGVSEASTVTTRVESSVNKNCSSSIRKRTVFERRMLDALSNHARVSIMENDDDRLFLLSLLPMMKQIPLSTKLPARIEMSQVVAKYMKIASDKDGGKTLPAKSSYCQVIDNTEYYAGEEGGDDSSTLSGFDIKFEPVRGVPVVKSECDNVTLSEDDD